jgi:hypothetical protein
MKCLILLHINAWEKGRTMEIEVRKLTPELLDYRLDYFDNVAFADGDE